MMQNEMRVRLLHATHDMQQKTTNLYEKGTDLRKRPNCPRAPRADNRPGRAGRIRATGSGRPSNTDVARVERPTSTAGGQSRYEPGPSGLPCWKGLYERPSHYPAGATGAARREARMPPSGSGQVFARKKAHGSSPAGAMSSAQ